MKRFTLFILILLLPLFVACDRAPRVPPLPEGAVILAFGDSLTYGVGAEKGEAYPEVLERLLGRKVVNGGVPGETTSQGLKRLPELLAEVQPDLVILCHGGNDMIQKLDATILIDNLKAMIRLIQEADAEVLLIAVPPPAAYFQPAPFYARMARELGVPILVNELSNIVTRSENRSEGIHPNGKGYAALAEAISKSLRTTGR